ncbi:MAG: hypothetical protein QME65_02220 [Candidatus Omnitrophota bacterium]|nr:hypothetical protein [Candidatus Omnitrophota bacterium]
MKRRVVLIVTAVLLITASACAETIILKSGEEIQGAILERTGDAITVDFNGAEVTYSLDEVALIDGEEPVIFSPQVSPDIGIMAEPEPLPAVEAAVAPKQKQPEPVASPSKAKPVAAAVSILVALLALVFILSFYIYTSLCLQFIAKKTDTTLAWLAWIPVANIFLMCKIVSLSYWWISILLLAFLPYAGAFVSVGFFGFLWYKIALARNKPGWVGILAVVPIVNLVVYGYLAFGGNGSASLKSVSLPPNQPKADSPQQPSPPPV